MEDVSWADTVVPRGSEERAVSLSHGECALLSLLNHLLVGSDVDFHATVLGAAFGSGVGGHIVGHWNTFG